MGAQNTIYHTLLIKKPTIEEQNGKARQVCEIIESIGETKNVKLLWFEVDQEYRYGLCDDLCDAYVVGLLNYCMRNKFNIISDIPMSESLYVNLTEHLIPILQSTDKRLFPITIRCELKSDESIKCGKYVGTGLSCGVDSLHSVMKYCNYPINSQKLTHLCINNVGSFNEIYLPCGIDKVRNATYKRAETVAMELNLPLIKTDSNFQHVFKQQHFLTNTYSSAFAILMLRYHWKKYYLASVGIGCETIVLKDNSLDDSAHYDLISLQYLSPMNLEIASESPQLTRFEKIKNISEYDIAKKYIHSCLWSEVNCGKCPKCLRNLWALDAIGKLSDFKKSYNIENYLDNRKNNLLKLVFSKEGSFINDIKKIFLINKDPEYEEACKISQIIREHLIQYDKDNNLEACYKIFEQYYKEIDDVTIYYAKAKIYGKGTTIDLDGAKMALSTPRVAIYPETYKLLSKIKEMSTKNA